MTIDELKSRISAIDSLIKTSVTSQQDDTSAICDGIIDPERYLNAKYKIMWVLKEPVDDFDDEGKPCGGGWSLMEALRNKNSFHDFTEGLPTFRPMIYSAVGILNDFILYDDIPNLEDDPTVLEAFRSIGYINISKLPGLRRSSPSALGIAYQKYKDILLRQVVEYNPDIIIGGSTLDYFLKDLELLPTDFTVLGNLRYAMRNRKIYIDAYHPSYWVVKEEEYCNDIIMTAKLWANA